MPIIALATLKDVSLQLNGMLMLLKIQQAMQDEEHKETVASQGETGGKAGSEVPALVLKPGSPLGTFALP